MFSAVYMISFAEGLGDAAKRDFTAALGEKAAAVSSVNLLAPVLEYAFNGGDMFLELGFKDQPEYEAAKEAPAYGEMLSLLGDGALVASHEFVAYGEGLCNVTSREAKCHRVLIFETYEGSPVALHDRMQTLMADMYRYIPGLLNCKIARVLESSGRRDWTYAFECDYDEPMTFLTSYMFRPYHWCNVDKFFEPACAEFIVNPDLCTPYCQAEGAFLANYQGD